MAQNTAPLTKTLASHFYSPPNNHGNNTQNAEWFVENFGTDGVIVLTYGEESYATALRTAGYVGKILRYTKGDSVNAPGWAQSGSGSVSRQPYRNSPSHIPYPSSGTWLPDWIKANHPDWFLHEPLPSTNFIDEATGNVSQYGYYFYLNMTNSACREFIASRIWAMHNDVWDGVFIDNGHIEFHGATGNEQATKEYGSGITSTYAPAFRAFIQAIKDAAPDGQEVWVNYQGEDLLAWRRMIYDDVNRMPLIDGVMIEYIGLWGSQGAKTSEAGKRRDIDKIALADALGVPVLAVSHDYGDQNDTSKGYSRFTLAMLAMGWGVNTLYRGATGGGYGALVFVSTYDDFLDLGAPTGPMTSYGTALQLQRQYERWRVRADLTNGTNSGSFIAEAPAPEFWKPYVTAPIERQGTVGEADDWQIYALPGNTGTTLSYSGANLPPGKTVNPITGAVTGIITAPCSDLKFTSEITVTETDGVNTSSVTYTFSYWVKPGALVARINFGDAANRRPIDLTEPDLTDAAIQWRTDVGASWLNAGSSSTTNLGTVPTFGSTIPPWARLNSTALSQDRVGRYMRQVSSSGFSYDIHEIAALDSGVNYMVIVYMNSAAESAGVRSINVSANGSVLQSNIDPVAISTAQHQINARWWIVPVTDGTLNLAIAKGAGASAGRASYAEVYRITPPAAPVIAPIGNQSKLAGQTFSFTVTATDVDETIPELSVEGEPDGATFIDNADGTGDFEWTTDESDIGDHDVTFIAKDEDDNEARQTVTLTVLSSLAPPTVDPISNQVNTVGDVITPLQIEATASNEGTTFIYEVDPDFPLPVGLMVDATGKIRGKLHSTSWTQKKPVKINVYETDGMNTSAAATVTFIWWVKRGTLRERINPGGPTSGSTLTAIDTDTNKLDWWNDNDTTPYAGIVDASGSTPSHNAINAQTPDVNVPPWIPDEIARDLRSDSSAPYVGYDVTVPGAGNYLVNVGYASGVDTAGQRYMDLSLAGVQVEDELQPRDTVGGAADTYTLRSYPVTTAGTTLAIRMSRGTGGASAARNTFYEVYDAPTVGASAPVITSEDSVSAAAGTLLTYTLTTTSDDGTIPELSSDDLPAGATFTDNGDGTATVEWTPTLADVGEHVAEFTAADPIGGVLSDTLVVTFTITVPAPVLDIIDPDTFAINEGTSGRLLTATVSTPETGTLVFDLDTDAAFLTATQGDNSTLFVDYTTAAAGEYTLTITVTGDGGSDDQTVALTVRVLPKVERFEVNGAPVTSVTILEGESAEVKVYVSDPDALLSSVTYPITPPPPSGLEAFISHDYTGDLDPDPTDTMTITPQEGDAGSYTLIYTTRSFYGPDNTMVLTVNVTAPSDAEPANAALLYAPRSRQRNRAR